MRQTLMALVLALSLPLLGCQQDGGGGGETPPAANQEPIPGPVPAGLGQTYEQAYVAMAETYMSLVQADWDQASARVRVARGHLEEIRQQAGETLPETLTDDIASARELERMIADQNPRALNHAKDLMIELTEEATSPAGTDFGRPAPRS